MRERIVKWKGRNVEWGGVRGGCGTLGEGWGGEGIWNSRRGEEEWKGRNVGFKNSSIERGAMRNERGNGNEKGKRIGRSVGERRRGRKDE